MKIIKQAPVTSLFIASCLLISIPAVFITEYFNLFTGTKPHTFFWQKFTMVFLHGEKLIPVSILIHLLFNLFLLITCGTQVEKLLGFKKFILLTLTAWVTYILTQYISGLWINGASGIIWAYSPFLLIPIRWAKTNNLYSEKASQNKILLIIMWVMLTVVMGFVPFLFNPNHHLVYTFIFGNLFHAIATLTGFVYFVLWKPKFKKPPIGNIF